MGKFVQKKWSRTLDKSFKWIGKLLFRYSSVKRKTKKWISAECNLTTEIRLIVTSWDQHGCSIFIQVSSVRLHQGIRMANNETQKKIIYLSWCKSYDIHSSHTMAFIRARRWHLNPTLSVLQLIEETVW